MRIEFERSGGFGGLRLGTHVEVDDLPEAEARVLRDLIEQARFFDLPEHLVPPHPGADRFQYRLTVDDGHRLHTVQAGDASLPEPLRPLVEQLTRHALRH